VDDEERRSIRHDFGKAVTMKPAELEGRLRTDESKSVGDSVGYVHRHLAQRPSAT
jgi:hypothetical protein